MNYRNIILEGTDRSGKSTLALRLSEALAFDSLKLRHQEGNQFERYQQFYQLANRAVFDRSHISEEVYCPIYGRPPSFTREELGKLDTMVNQSCLVIFCLPPLDVALKRLAKQEVPTEKITPQDLGRSLQLFHEASRRFPNHLVHHSGPWEETEQLIQRVCDLFDQPPRLYQT
jgi:thymidylate kinase